MLYFSLHQVIQSLSICNRLIGFVMNILAKLITKQVSNINCHQNTICLSALVPAFPLSVLLPQSEIFTSLLVTNSAI